MKPMPIQQLPPDEEWLYIPDSDSWIVQKKSGNKILSKKDITAYEGGYPTENDATTWGAAAPGTYAYQPNINHDAPTGLREGDDGEPITICPQCKSQNIDKESSPAKCQDCGVDFIPSPDRGSDDPTSNDYSQNYFWGPNDLGRSHQNQPGANGWLPAGSEDMDGPSPNVRMSSFKSFMHKQSSLNKVAHCGPCSVLKMEALHILIDLCYKNNNLFPEEVIEELSLAATELKVDNFNDILESVIEEYLEEKAEEVGDKLPKLKNLLIALKDIAPKLGNEIEVVDKQENVEKEAAKEEYPKISKPKSGYVDNGIGYTCGRCEYFNPEREKCKKVEGTIKSFGCCNFWDGEGKFKEKHKTAGKKALETDKRALTKEEAVYVQYPNVDYRCDECAFFNAEAKTCTKVDGEISPTASCNFWQPIKNKQGNLNKKAEIMEISIKNGPLFPITINPSGNEARGLLEKSQERQLRYTYDEYGTCYLWDAYYGTHFDVKKELHELGFPITEEAPDEFVMGERDLSVFGSLNKQANPPSRFWIAPDGKEFEVAGIHPVWVKNNLDMLHKQYGIMSNSSSQAYDELVDKGWVGISNEPYGTGFVIQVKDMWHPPAFLDDFIAKYFTEGDTVVLASNDQNYLNIPDPFPTLQQVVNKMSRGSKKASLIDEVLDQTTQDAIAAEYGPSMLIALRFYNDAVRYGQSPDRAVAYALEEVKRMHRPIEYNKFLEVLDTYF